MGRLVLDAAMRVLGGWADDVLAHHYCEVFAEEGRHTGVPNSHLHQFSVGVIPVGIGERF